VKTKERQEIRGLRTEVTGERKKNEERARKQIKMKYIKNSEIRPKNDEERKMTEQ
jgi:uncharacterized OsmC-like protein